MDIKIGSRHIAADISVALDAAGREHLLIVSKCTWTIPQPGQRPRPLPPLPLAQADEYYGEPGLSAMRYGSDYARFKPRCDVLFDACAHSAEPVPELIAAWQVGPLNKGIKVLGPRTWRRSCPDKPGPFTVMPLHFGLAFGGSRTYRKAGQDFTECLPENPAGQGFAGPNTLDQIEGLPVPNLEARDEAIVRPNSKCHPVAFSAIGRHWAPRKNYAGTYDEAWRQSVFPFLPEDFDERFEQFAPEDQQMAYPKGGEEVILTNMMANRARVRFHLPALDQIAVRVLRADYTSETLNAVADTLFFEPELERFSVVWRVSTPIRRRLQEFASLAIGPVDPAWWAARAAGLERGGCATCGQSPTLRRLDDDEEESAL